MRRFTRRGGSIEVNLDRLDMTVLQLVPELLGNVGELGVDPAAARLEPAVYPDDTERSAEFRHLAEDMIEGGRRADLEAFLAGWQLVTAGEPLTSGQAESWMRALTTARLILGARLGIEEDGWEESGELDPADGRVIALHVLARLQASLVRALSQGL